MTSPQPVAIIPARGGSKRLPRKNLAEINGVPLLGRTVGIALRAGVFSRVLVSTEDEEIAAVAESYGAEIVSRPQRLATDSASVAEVCQQVLDALENSSSLPDKFCCIYATAGFLLPEDLVSSRRLMDGDHDVIMGVCSYPIHPFKALTENNGALVPLWPERALQKSQSYPEAFASNGTFYWARTQVFRAVPTFYPERLAGYVVPPERAIDIDTEADLNWARLVAKVQTSAPVDGG